jgi:hypothetical protein
MLSSIQYSNDDNITVKSKNVKNVKDKNTTNIYTIRPETLNNCYVFNITSINSNSAYSVSGKFNNSCVSVYDQFDEKVCSYICNDYKNVVLSCNENILSPVFKLTNYKTLLIPLAINQSYKVIIDHVEELKIQNYTVNFLIEHKDIPFNYDNKGVNEYDIDRYVKSKMINNTTKNLSQDTTELERMHLSNFNREDEWVFNKEGDYVVALVRNAHNYEVKGSWINEHNELSNINIKNKKTNEPSYIELIKVKNPNITMYNLEYIKVKRDINTEYLDLITGPNYLLEKFLYGKKGRDVNYSLFINNRFLIYKIKN